MVCNNCKNPVEEGSAFCAVCGSKVVANDMFDIPHSNYGIPPMDYRKPVSVGGWIGRYLISFIPVVGPLIYIIMLFVWAFDSSREKTFSNWAKAQLILTLISAILVALMFVVYIFVIASIFGGMSTGNYYYY